MLKLIVIAVLAVVGGLKVGGVLESPPQAAVPQTASAQTPAAVGAADQMVEITEADLTASLNQRLAGQPLGDTPLGPATLSRLTTQLRGGKLNASGDAQVRSATVPVALSGAVHVEGDRPVMVVEDLRAAGVPLPASARASVQEALQAQLEAEVARLQLRVTSVTIEDGKLRLVGTRRL